MGLALRFDDTLETVLASDLGSPQAAQSAWRQLVDLIGRRRVPPDAHAMSVLRAIRGTVPAPARTASARALEFADPPAPLVRLLATDDLPIALPVLRTARMTSGEWVQLLPELAPAARSVLRNRRDLGPIVKRALDAFGPIDFVLPDGTVKEAVEAEAVAAPAPVEMPLAYPALEIEAEPELAAATVARAPRIAEAVQPVSAPAEAEARAEDVAQPVAEAIEEDFSFVSLAAFAPALNDSLPVNTEQSEISPEVDQSGTVESLDPAGAIAPSAADTQNPDMEFKYLSEIEAPDAPEGGTFEIAEVVARIDAFWRHREENGVAEPRPIAAAEHFRFETDPKGVFRWIDGVSRSPLVGLSLDAQAAAVTEVSRVDGVAAGAFRRRAGFANARLIVAGESDAAGDWLISAIPVFDPANGRFTGYRGTARRPRSDERAEPARPPAPQMPPDSLRQLVHELRTPTNAIAGFAEMIERQILGPVGDPYRERAHEIRTQARELLGAIDDLDLAARIESAALALVPGRVALRQVLTAIADDLAPLLALRGSVLALPIDDLAVIGDRRAVERLLARLLATLVSASGEGERIAVDLAQHDDMVALTVPRPKALADYPGDSVLGIDDEHEDTTLLGTGFALRLARNLARELGGALLIGAETLTLRLPASDKADMDQAHLS